MRRGRTSSAAPCSRSSTGPPCVSRSAIIRPRPPRSPRRRCASTAPAKACCASRLHDVEIGGTMIPVGALVLSLIGSANRDPEHWSDPDDFQLNRPNIGDHLAFGSGIHYCIGNALARMEATAAIEEIMRRLPDLAPAGVPERIASPVLRGLRTQPVTITRTASATGPSIR
ncbi:cytochrome P450 [Nocardia sp. FBN12]|uniref:cytochrome P450 n=1 Tax=Nocardia sp. FBN12 TaxID=3419766 RepID=UPI003D043777